MMRSVLFGRLIVGVALVACLLLAPVAPAAAGWLDLSGPEQEATPGIDSIQEKGVAQSFLVQLWEVLSRLWSLETTVAASSPPTGGGGTTQPDCGPGINTDGCGDG